MLYCLYTENGSISEVNINLIALLFSGPHIHIKQEVGGAFLDGGPPLRKLVATMWCYIVLLLLSISKDSLSLKMRRS